ncbi:MAG: hypothetical protein O9289_03280 [Rhodobacteraceae bacterium]|jgi:hypothetical protein|nr:hypothetical protein [Paracoccaceae bacterium]MCZ8082199.1 hypothetical protein [Paracoccaceae bacterium]
MSASAAFSANGAKDRLMFSTPCIERAVLNDQGSTLPFGMKGFSGSFVATRFVAFARTNGQRTRDGRRAFINPFSALAERFDPLPTSNRKSRYRQHRQAVDGTIPKEPPVAFLLPRRHPATPR